MRIIASIVTKNETSRYFQSMLEHNKFWWNDLFVYDDRSEDDTVEMALEYTDSVFRRPLSAPSFIEHEGDFRSNALRALVDKMSIAPGDWIFAIDSDEFLFTDYGRYTLPDIIEHAVEAGKTSVNLKIPEIWSINHSRLHKRVDGFWDTMSLPRLYQYKDGWSFRNKAMGSGSGPSYTYNDMYQVEYHESHLLHVGYADEDDRIAKHKRYTSLKNHGHNPLHIRSIIEEPELEEYVDFSPRLWRGRI